MAMSSGFFESNIDDAGEYDRVYFAQQFAHYFSQFIGNGVFGNPTNQLQVMSLENNTMTVLVRDGNAFINGYWFRSTENETLTITNASGTFGRIDAIVVGYSALTREISLYIKEGKYAEDPVPPELSRTDDNYELCLALIMIEPNQTEITGANIIDTRPIEQYCGFVIGLVQQLETRDLFAQYTSIFKSWFSSIKDMLDGDEATKLARAIYNLEGKHYGFDDKITSFSEDGNKIFEHLIDTDYEIVTTFEEDGSITSEMYNEEQVLIRKKITRFEPDGSIKEEVIS